jgi:hypothetical protein
MAFPPFQNISNWPHPLQRDHSLARRSARTPLRIHFHPQARFWLNLVEGFFSKLARSGLRHIRVASKQELKHRLMAAVEFFNGDPVIDTSPTAPSILVTPTTGITGFTPTNQSTMPCGSIITNGPAAFC